MWKRSALSFAVILSITWIPLPSNAGAEEPGDLQEMYFNPTDLRHLDLKLDGLWKTSLGLNFLFQDGELSLQDEKSSVQDEKQETDEEATPEGDFEEGENASNPLAKIRNTDLRWQYLDLDDGKRVNDYSVDGSFMPFDFLKMRYELHYWETNRTGSSERDWEKLVIKPIFFPKDGLWKKFDIKYRVESAWSGSSISGTFIKGSDRMPISSLPSSASR